MSLDFLRAVFGCAILAAAAYGAGGWMERMLPASFSRIERLLCCWMAGFGLLGSSLFLVGQVLFTRSVIIAVVCICLVAAIATSRTSAIWTADALRELAPIPVLPAIIIGFVLGITLLAAGAPIAGVSDGTLYHYLGPQVWLREGVVRPVLGAVHTAFPATGEVVFGVLMVLGGPLAPGMSAVLTMIAFVLIIFAVSQRVAGLDREGAWWVAALVAAMPTVHAGAHTGNVDVLFAGFVLVAAMIAFDAERPRHYAMLGLFCGLALGTKYTGLLAMPALLLVPLLSRPGTKSPGPFKLWHGLALAMFVACLPSAPFYLRNWIVLGCPIYPPLSALSNICSVRYVSPESASAFSEFMYTAKGGGGFGRGLSAYLGLPFNLTYHTDLFHGAGGIGVAVLALAPIGLSSTWSVKRTRALALFAFVLLNLWFVTQQQSRFLIHVYVIGAIFAVHGWRYMSVVSPRASRYLSGSAIALSVLYGCLAILADRKQEAHAALSSAYAGQRMREQTPMLASMGYLNQEPSVKKVLVLERHVPRHFGNIEWHVPVFYLEKPFVLSYDGWRGGASQDTTNFDETLPRLRQLGVTHVLDVGGAWHQPLVPRASAVVSLVFEKPSVRIYRVH